MRFSMIVTILALAVAAFFLAQRGRGQQEFTTSSADAYQLYQQGDEQLNAFQWSSAVESLQKAIELDPDFAMAHAALAEVFRSLHGYDRAKVTAVRADSLAGLLDDENERMLVQVRLSASGLLESCSRDSLLAILQVRLPDHPIVLSSRALTAQRQGRRDEAARIWRQLLQINPNYARANNWLGYLAAGKGEYDQALSYLNKYAFLAPELANPHDSLGEILTFTGRYDEAAAEFRRALELQPDFFISLINLARVYAAQGRVATCVDILAQTREQIAGTEYEKMVDRILLGLYWTHGFADELRAATKHFFTAYPDNFNSGFYRSLYLAGQGRMSEATAVRDSFLTAVKDEDYFKEDSSPDAYARLQHSTRATFAMVSGEIETAAVEWAQALSRAKDLAPHEQFTMRTHLSETLFEIGRFDEALAQTELILSVNPQLIQPQLVRTEALLQLNRHAEARAALERLEEILANADTDLPAVLRADELRKLLSERTSS